MVPAEVGVATAAQLTPKSVVLSGDGVEIPMNIVVCDPCIRSQCLNCLLTLYRNWLPIWLWGISNPNL